MKDVKFAYRHRPTKRWVYITKNRDHEYGGVHYQLYFINEFTPDVLYSARNIIEEDFLNSWYLGDLYAKKNFLEFELVKIEIEYKIPE